MEELLEKINTKATEYLQEDEDIEIEKIPTSIVDFVWEQFFNAIPFPHSYSEERQIKIMSKYVNTMAMACVELYRKYGVEGQMSYNINKSSRVYDATFISPSLFDSLPNFMDF